MTASGLQGVTRPRPKCTTRSQPGAQVPYDRVRRRLEASGPNQPWVADITCVPAAEGFLYLAIVLHVFSRNVVCRALGARQTTALAVAALEMAEQARGSRGLIFHSDRGSQYTA